MQEEAKKRIRFEFRSNLTETNPEKIDSLLKKGIENLNFLKKNVIQGVQSEQTGAYCNFFSFFSKLNNTIQLKL